MRTIVLGVPFLGILLKFVRATLSSLFTLNIRNDVEIEPSAECPLDKFHSYKKIYLMRQCVRLHIQTSKRLGFCSWCILNLEDGYSHKENELYSRLISILRAGCVRANKKRIKADGGVCHERHWKCCSPTIKKERMFWEEIWIQYKEEWNCMVWKKTTSSHNCKLNIRLKAEMGKMKGHEVISKEL